ncbi:MAG: exodeoxyribonuclease VII large subunit [Clostridia bacterium]|nr:exodeoxyribonuclease VII large subunit [Clostridia bacterium]
MTTLTVKQLNLFVKSLIEGDVRLNNVYVMGEISNFKNHYQSGHYYFTLKDNDAQIRCVMFRAYASRVPFMARDGLKVVLRGRVSLYEKDGQYQFYAEEMHEQGLGDISLQFRQIKEKLEKEGLFAEENKRPIPAFPKRIAVITSDTGAAVQDILNITARRYPLCEIMLCPVAVQGENAVPSMINALDRVYSLSNCDTIIIGRGGGSIEDLWAFNSEALARKIYESPIPVISAVGHETDFTICDFVSDLRAPTPSAAAELAVPDSAELLSKLKKCDTLLKNGLLLKYNSRKAKFDALVSRSVLSKPFYITEVRNEAVDRLNENMLNAFKDIVIREKSRFVSNVAKLDALSPLKVLSRGYAIAEVGGKTVKSVNDLNIDDEFKLRLSDGVINCKTVGKEK